MSDIDQYLTEEVAEKALAAGNAASECYYGCPSDMTTTEMHAALAAVLPDIIRQAKAEALAEGDGYHTHEELYEYRMLYNAHAARGWLAAGIPVIKSWRHSDGALCFGGGWFVIYVTLPSGQVSNHYKAEFWDLFDVPEVDLAPEYDGHTPAEAADRLRASLSVVLPDIIQQAKAEAWVEGVRAAAAFAISGVGVGASGGVPYHADLIERGES